jgi:hypothetical protein
MELRKTETQHGQGMLFRIRKPTYMIVCFGTQNKSINGIILRLFKMLNMVTKVQESMRHTLEWLRSSKESAHIETLQNIISKELRMQGIIQFN